MALVHLYACGGEDVAAARVVHDRGARDATGVQAALQPKLVPVRSQTARESRARDRSSTRDARARELGDADALEDVDEGAESDGAGTRAGDRVAPREVPEGTPPHIARVFRRLPVSVRDGPPLGGIGASGIHVDQLSLGDRYGRRGCTGKQDNFSIGERDQVNVCFRVVHNRVEEAVTVVWEKDGDRVKRRRGIAIPGMHAYRSRAFLVLRREYTARWTVRIFSEDDVELASTTFSVVE
ncbi:MAG: hypothetical protein KC468_16245 [Myxococcales bacterium]|nr:hypothetical protein [Myxococcales bacterium]